MSNLKEALSPQTYKHSFLGEFIVGTFCPTRWQTTSMMRICLNISARIEIVAIWSPRMMIGPRISMAMGMAIGIAMKPFLTNSESSGPKVTSMPFSPAW